MEEKSEIIYVPMPVMNTKQARLTKHYKFVRYTNYVLQFIGVFIGIWLFLELSPEVIKAGVLSKKQLITNMMLYLWLTCMVVTVVFSLIILTIIRSTRFSVITFWGHWPVKGEHFFEDKAKLEQVIASSSTSKDIRSFKGAWIFNIVLTILAFILITRQSTSAFMLSMARIWMIAIIIDGLFNLWVQVVFDDLKFTIAKITDPKHYLSFAKTRNKFPL
ncbi:hypothetical protein [Lactobacillus sp.]|uniref:hypothetical protein n=1 Tax=Lactobacillus sp. TaxID=1591 RepID=UPI0019BF0EBD|nr:hypothetical protein [Lactobacillus sp.]MBD5430520.1 hypothetical protein [Lactobacillus sp.]MBD5430811.1 hypothetical protein [Lactobacillus sp.]